MIRWLDIYRNLGADQLYERFRSLDEEYQTGLLSSMVDLIEEETYEKLTDMEQDRFRPLPCNTLWYAIKTDDPEIESFVEGILKAGLANDVGYAYSLLAHATQLPPNEQEHLMLQFRNARIEEDGFANADESQAIFAPFDGKKLIEQWHVHSAEQGLYASAHQGLFLDSVLHSISVSSKVDHVANDHLQKSFLQLANMLTTACGIDPDNISAIKLVLEQARNLVSLGLEILSSGDAERGLEILLSLYPKTIFRFALSAVDDVRQDALDLIKALGWPGYESIRDNFSARKFGPLLWAIDTNLLNVGGFDTCEMLKGLFNRFPMIKDHVITADGTSRIVYRPMAAPRDLFLARQALQEIEPPVRAPLSPITQSTDASH